MEQKKLNIAVMDAEAGTLYVLPVTAPPPGTDIGLEEWIEAQLTSHNIDGPDVEWMEVKQIRLDVEWMEVKQIRLDLSAMLIHISSFRETTVLPK